MHKGNRILLSDLGFSKKYAGQTGKVNLKQVKAQAIAQKLNVVGQSRLFKKKAAVKFVNDHLDLIGILPICEKNWRDEFKKDDIYGRCFFDDLFKNYCNKLDLTVAFLKYLLRSVRHIFVSSVSGVMDPRYYQQFPDVNFGTGQDQDQAERIPGLGETTDRVPLPAEYTAAAEQARITVAKGGREEKTIASYLNRLRSSCWRRNGDLDIYVYASGIK
jgi:hypothetical protein